MPDLFEFSDLFIGVVGDPSVSREAFYEGFFPRAQHRVTPQAVNFRAVIARTYGIAFVSLVHLFFLTSNIVEIVVEENVDPGVILTTAKSEDVGVIRVIPEVCPRVFEWDQVEMVSEKL